MSQPKRFRCLTTEEQREFNNKVIMPGLVMCDDGNLVAYSDYAALAAENDYLKSQVNRLQPVRYYEHYLAGKIQRSKYEVERLRKAGDAMAGVIGLPLNKTQADAHIAAWNAAKEGRDAK